MYEKDDFEEFMEQEMKNPDFKAAYEAMEPERQLIAAMIAARRGQGVTQKELSKRTGIPQADISRFENGNSNPTYATLVRLAQELGMRFEIKLVPA